MILHEGRCEICVKNDTFSESIDFSEMRKRMNSSFIVDDLASEKGVEKEIECDSKTKNWWYCYNSKNGIEKRIGPFLLRDEAEEAREQRDVILSIVP